MNPVATGSLVCKVLAAAMLLADGQSTGYIRDQAKVFSPAAVERAEHKIGDVFKQFNKEIFVETYAQIPVEQRESVRRMDRRRSDQFFEKWVNDRVRELRVNGVYIMICMEPARVYTAVGQETKKWLFLESEAQALRKTIIERFKDKRYDDGLTQAISFLETAMAKNAKSPARTGTQTAKREGPSRTGETDGQPRPVATWGWILLVVGGLFALWMIVGVFRAIAQMGTGAGYGGGAGGGFLSGLMGGLFGAVAGHWIYDSFFRGDHWSGYSHTPHAGEFDNGEGFRNAGHDGSDVGGDYAIGGDSFDAGGFDAGGGDFGGGDF